MVMVNVYPDSKRVYWSSSKSKICDCKFTNKQVKRLRVVYRWFLPDGTALINKNVTKQGNWRMKK